MQILGTILTIIFVVVAFILILVIMIQSNRSAGMGLFGGGGSQTAFGSSSADVLTKFTGVMTAIFLVLALTLAFIKSKGSDAKSIQDELNKSITTETTETTTNEDNATDPAEPNETTETNEPAQATTDGN